MAPVKLTLDCNCPLTIAALAERWAYSEPHIRNVIREKKLKCFMAGNVVRIPVAAVETMEAVQDEA